MELRVLRYFLMVAQEESMTRASALLHITQPTLSRQMHDLEEEVGVALFQRGARKIALTPEGMLLRRRAEEIIQLADKTERELTQQDKILEGEISIGIGETQSMNDLAGRIGAFRREHPQVRFQVYTATADMIKERIENGLLDLGILTYPADTRKYEFLPMPGKDHWCALLRRDDPLAQKEALSPRDLAAVPLILPQREAVRSELLRRLSLNEGELKVAALSNLELNGAILVREGVGIFLCLGVNDFFEELCRRPLSPGVETSSVLVWKRGLPFSPVTERFIDFLQERIGPA